MRYLKFLIALPLLALVACDDDGVSVNPVPDAALIRFFNMAAPASPATATAPAAVDLNFVDHLETLPTFRDVAFRAHSGAGYHRVERTGVRHVRVFPNSMDIDVASTQLVNEPNLSLPANQRFTLILTRNAQGHQLHRLEDPHPIAGSIPRAPRGQIAVRVINSATHHAGPVDVYVVPVATATTARPADWQDLAVHRFQNVGQLQQSAYVNVPVRGPAAGGAQRYMFVVTAAGSTDPLFHGTPNVPGDLTTQATAGPSPGVTIEESVLTVVVTPSPSPTAIMVVDRTLDPPWPTP